MAYLVFFGGLGMLAGALARWWLGWLRRGARISPPWCELLVGVLWAVSGSWWASGRLATPWLPLLLGMSWLAVAAGMVDLACQRLPDALTLPALPVALLLAAPLGAAAVGRAVLCAFLLAGTYLVVRLAVPAALGAGDVKLAAPLGAALGAVSWWAVLLGAFGGALLTLGLALVISVGRVLVPRWAGGRLVARFGLAEGTGGDTRLAGSLPTSAGRLLGGAASRDGPGGVPHGPAMVVAGWLVLAAAGTGGVFGPP